ncbi:hypothetical protein ATK36_3122 [Amycolatopsis sulphurea]|uniref:Uncharacterized protein n=1 Tax=Amycolatopsis sulphurea TaxID=76022 RepID=A0A2A9FA56_9PSEU|nr:hypothetical protein [Amycolatopsis sulphurea]PFG48048.1 hypothetical protein ATK36_3122 [Amycolatopsis sulphurea]
MFEDVEFTVATGEARASAPDGFVLEPDEAKQLLEKLKGIRGRQRKMKNAVANLCGIAAPSKDPSTLAAHVALVGDGAGKLGAYSYGGGHVDLQLAYLNELIQRIEAALGMTKSSDHQQTSLMNSVSSQEKTT